MVYVSKSSKIKNLFEEELTFIDISEELSLINAIGYFNLSLITHYFIYKSQFFEVIPKIKEQ